MTKRNQWEGRIGNDALNQPEGVLTVILFPIDRMRSKLRQNVLSPWSPHIYTHVSKMKTSFKILAFKLWFVTSASWNCLGHLPTPSLSRQGGFLPFHYWALLALIFRTRNEWRVTKELSTCFVAMLWKCAWWSNSESSEEELSSPFDFASSTRRKDAPGGGAVNEGERNQREGLGNAQATGKPRKLLSVR